MFWVHLELLFAPESGGGASGEIAIPFRRFRRMSKAYWSLFFAQIGAVDGFFGDADPNSNLHNTEEVYLTCHSASRRIFRAVQLCRCHRSILLLESLLEEIFLMVPKMQLRRLNLIKKGNIKEGMTQAAQSYDAFNDTKRSDRGSRSL